MGLKAWAGKRGKRGDTLVEIVVSIAVLGLVVIGTLTAFNVSRQMVARSNSADHVNARAQDIADILMADLTNVGQAAGGALQGQLVTDCGAVFVPIRNDTDDYQFHYEYAHADALGISGWKITVWARNPMGDFITLKAFAPC